jgi:signal transduction histidine kinase
MKRIRSLFWQASPLRALVEGWLVCLVLLVPMVPVLLETTPSARSLYLVLLPLVCAVVTGLRLRFFARPAARALIQACGLAILLGLGILGSVMGLLAGLSQLDSIQHSFAGTGGTIFFLLMAAPEMLGVQLVSWAWQRWNYLRRRRYVWALTHAILRVVGAAGLLVLTGTIIYFVHLLGSDIWGIPPDSVFAQAVFWLSMLVLLAFLLFGTGILLFLPPTTLFSFLVARKMTARLENLAAGTQAVRKGDLSARVGVQGEDEVAQLQTDFNAMAADLEKSVLDLQSEKDKVWRLLEARRELVAGVSHELRNPVATILGYSDSLRRDWKEHSPEEVQRDLETIQYEASRLQAILNDLLTASQAEAGRLTLTLQKLDVNILVQRVVETFSGLAWGSKRVHINLSAPPHAVFGLADPLRLEQVLVNLVQNAVRHTSPGGLVALEVHPGPDSICIEVEDTGEGISPEDLPHIWEKYYRAGSAQRGAPHGMGLGLALVKELTEAMGGTVSVESWPGQGSLFQVHLPACAPGEHTL